MSKRVSPRIVAGAVAGLAVAGGGAAVAAAQFTSPKQESQAVVNDAAKQLGIQPSKLSAALEHALENRVDAAVAAGRLTKAQGEELKQRIEAGDVPLFGGPGFGRGGEFHHLVPFGGLDTAATYLGLTEAQLEIRIRDGETLSQIAKAQDKPASGLVDAMVAALQKHLDQAVREGRLTEAQEKQVLADAKARITDFVDGKRPPFDRDHDGGFGFRGGPPPGAPGI
jgi:hypothetical protein